MFRIIPLCTALVVAIPMSRCHHPSDKENCSLTGAPDGMIQGRSAIINRGTDKDLVGAYSNRCLAYEIRGDHDRAIADCDQAIKLDPKYARAYAGRGLVYEDKGDHDRAITDYGMAIELDPKLPAVYAKRGLVYAKKGDKQHAIADLSEAIELDPANEGFKKTLSILGKMP